MFPFNVLYLSINYMPKGLVLLERKVLHVSFIYEIVEINCCSFTVYSIFIFIHFIQQMTEMLLDNYWHIGYSYNSRQSSSSTIVVVIIVVVVVVVVVLQLRETEWSNG